MARVITLGDRQLNRIGLGTNRLTDTPENRSFIQGAVAAGVNHIDTAHLYTSGESESTIGAALEHSPDKPLIATKGGYNGGQPEQLRKELEQSFERLRTETLDLYYLHRVDPTISLENQLAVFKEYRDAGRIRNVGISEVSIDQIELARTMVPIAAVQNEYSLGERKYDEVVDFCAEEGLVFVPFFPLRGGDKATLGEIASNHDATPQQIKLAWLLKRSPGMAPIPGTLSLDHLKENLGALEIELSDEEFDRLNGA